jgi:glycosyltransferase domain-containing protein
MYTLIIPTLDRHDLLLRAIDYYQHFDCDVFIADSSDNKFNHKFPDNIIYKHLPKAKPEEKIYEVAKSITTPYVNLVGDDDFLLESSLKSAACFLDDNPGYVSAQGRYYKFELTENKVTFSPRYHLGTTLSSIEFEDRFTRIARVSNRNMHQIYSLIRVDLFVKYWKVLASPSRPLNLNWKNLPHPKRSSDNMDGVCFELISAFVPMCYGKHKILPILWMIRDYYIFNPIRRQKWLANKSKSDYSISYNYKHYTNEAKDVETFLDSENFLLLKQNFRENISDLVGSEESDKLCNVAFRSYIKFQIRERNKVITKLIIKLFTPNWALKYYKTSKVKQYASGIEDTLFKNFFNKVRLSVLNFKKCYDNHR